MLQTMFVTGYSVLCDDLFNLISIFVRCLNAKCLLKTMLLGFFKSMVGKGRGASFLLNPPDFFCFLKLFAKADQVYK